MKFIKHYGCSDVQKHVIALKNIAFCRFSRLPARTGNIKVDTPNHTKTDEPKQPNDTFARTNDATNVDTHSKWIPKGRRKTSQIIKSKIEQLWEKGGSAGFGTEDPGAQETHDI